ncbi:MAG: NADH-quinone oxidoreductase subunit L [Candidatus Bathyarchaeia archaeon]
MVVPAWLSWLFPIIGALLTPLFARAGDKVRDFAAIAFSLLGAVSAALLIPEVLAAEGPIDDLLGFDWIPLPAGLGSVKAGLLIDPLSVFMANVVAWISFLIMVYSLGYMHGEENLTRYWFFMDFFIGSMLLLVLSDNILQMFVGWEGVGLCSYGLIGFWHSDEKRYWVGTPPDDYPPSHAGMKAFVVTRIGDVSLLIAALIIYSYAHTFNFLELQRSSEWITDLARVGLLAPVAVLFFGGPVGKSAQFPLHEWLPEAMAGPTAVSALIHAATMVKAGVYLVARALPIFILHPGLQGTEVFFTAVAWIGGFTAFLAATQALVAREIKKVLAYSTVSQIGYMMLALGASGFMAEYAGGYIAGVFHLASHAVFKATLFLAAGSLIHVCGTKYMDEMGGLRKSMPITFLCMLIGALALAGFPPLSGFWSKDAILLATWEAGQYALFVLAVATAAITFAYSLRMIGVTFLGPKSRRLEEYEQQGGHVHEAPKVMYVPYLILTVATVAIGVAGPLFEAQLHGFFEPLLTGAGGEAHSYLVAKVDIGGFPPELAAFSASAIALVLGGIPGYYLYVARRVDPTQLVERNGVLKSVQGFLVKRWYINTVYYWVFVKGLLRVSGGLFRSLEQGGFDRFNYVFSGGILGFCRSFRRTHTGELRWNMLAFELGVLFILLLLVFSSFLARL